jgi:HAMP domain-containing protein
MAVAAGDLQQRTGIQRKDEIGSLASTFDMMTQKLAERNRELL